jgi:hypothetical protein
MYGSATDSLDHAVNELRLSMGSVRRAAGNVDDAISCTYSDTSKLDDISSQLWTIESSLRDLEGRIAQLHRDSKSSTQASDVSLMSVIEKDGE